MTVGCAGRKLLALLAAIGTLSAPCGGAVSAVPALGLRLAPCTQGRAKVPADCGSFGVYEDRRSASGRVISLHVVRLPAAHPTGRAIVFLPGGPGQSATALAPRVADGVFEKALGALRDRYDILFVDNRGMGGSHAFNCEFVPAAHPGYYFRQLWPDTLVSACRAKSRATSNPNLYNTINAVDDLDDVRAALGYAKLVLDGGSDGTFVALVYVRRHPTRVESAVLTGLVPPHFAPVPGAPAGAQSALDALVVRCRRDMVCRTHFPHFADHFQAVSRRFDRGPIPVRMRNSAMGRSQTVLLSKEVFVDRLRQTLYDPGNAAFVPYIVERAYREDYAPLSELIDSMSRLFAHALDWGAFLSYSCADWMPFISEGEVKREAAHSFAGDLRFRAQQRACALWNVRPMPAAFNEPVRSALPVLMISGSNDPATPPRNAQEALPYLPNAASVVVRGAGHTTETPCTDRLIVRFVRTGSAKNLNTSGCSAAFTPPPFATSG